MKLIKKVINNLMAILGYIPKEKSVYKAKKVRPYVDKSQLEIFPHQDWFSQ